MYEIVVPMCKLVLQSSSLVINGCLLPAVIDNTKCYNFSEFSIHFEGCGLLRAAPVRILRPVSCPGFAEGLAVSVGHLLCIFKNIWALM